ncbi:hypothetical protein CAAN1_39S00100 [[Candida] anglica]|uniref:Tag1-like fifth Ig-like domain-containing protein n=1 Tax=[Candida] anglica TaxID=148631 RepID=A0ABP0E9C5_9ASCO
MTKLINPSKGESVDRTSPPTETTPLVSNGLNGASQQRPYTDTASGGGDGSRGDLENLLTGGGGGGERRPPVANWATSSLYYRLHILSLILLVVMAVSLVLYAVFANLGDAVQTSFTSTITAVSLVGLSDRGVACHVEGSTVVNYDQVPSFWQRHALQLATAVVSGPLLISSRDPINIFLKPQGEPEYIQFVDVATPQFALNIKNHQTTPIDVLTDSQLNPANALKLSRYFLQEHATFDVNVQFLADFQLGMLHIAGVPVDFVTTVEMDRGNPKFEVQDWSMDTNHESSTVDYNATVVVTSWSENNSTRAVEFSLDPFEVSVALPDCQGHYVTMSDMKVGPLQVRRATPLVVELSGSVPPIDERLSRKCGGESPIEKMIRTGEVFISMKGTGGDISLKEEGVAFKWTQTPENAVHRLPPSRDCKPLRWPSPGEGHCVVPGVVESTLDQISDPQDSSLSLPSWLINLLQSIHIPINLSHCLSNHPLSPIISNVSVNSLSIHIPSDLPQLHLASNLSLSLALPELPSSNLPEISIPQFSTALSIYSDDGELILSGKSLSPMSSHQLSNTTPFNMFLSVTSFSLSIPPSSSDRFPAIINSLLLHEPVSLSISLYNLTANVLLPQLSNNLLTLTNLSLSNIPYQLNLPENNSNSTLADLVDISLSNITLVSSTLTELTVSLSVHLQLLSPQNLSVEFPLELFESSLYFDSMEICKVSLIDPLPTNITNSMTLSVEVTILNTQDNELALQQLISKFLSGFPHIEVDILDIRTIITGNENLSNIFSTIELYNLTLPTIGFQRDAISSTELIHSLGSGSPFLVDATIYLLKSEIEITVYNPLTNCNIVVDLASVVATYEGSELGHIGRHHMDINPGLYTSQRIPFTMNKGVGSDILRRALNDQLAIEIMASFQVLFKDQPFRSLDLLYKGSGLKTNIKL